MTVRIIQLCREWITTFPLVGPVGSTGAVVTVHWEIVCFTTSISRSIKFLHVFGVRTLPTSRSLSTSRPPCSPSTGRYRAL